VLFVSGNPRVVSNVVLAGLARLLGRPVVLWGQAHTAGAGKTTEKLRLGWWRGFDHLFVYTEGETRWLKARGFERQHVLGMNNGLDQERIDAAAAAWRSRGLESWRREQGVAERTQVLSCARLEPKNRFDLWLEAMPGVIAKVPDLLWCVVGEGVERPTLEAKTRQLGLENHVRWLGRIVDEDQLAPWFLTSRLLVHPGAIGLTLLHAFGYGLPVVTHDDPGTQMPEYDAFAAGENGLAYRSGDRAALAEAVLQGLGDELARQRMGREAHEVARERYNVRIMTERFEAMARQTAASTIERPARSEAS
jgi:glycosyltransferase involved in cell wall biosynthesis